MSDTPDTKAWDEMMTWWGAVKEYDDMATRLGLKAAETYPPLIGPDGNESYIVAHALLNAITASDLALIARCINPNLRVVEWRDMELSLRDGFYSGLECAERLIIEKLEAIKQEHAEVDAAPPEQKP